MTAACRGRWCLRVTPHWCAAQVPHCRLPNGLQDIQMPSVRVCAQLHHWRRGRRLHAAQHQFDGGVRRRAPRGCPRARVCCTPTTTVAYCARIGVHCVRCPLQPAFSSRSVQVWNTRPASCLAQLDFDSPVLRVLLNKQRCDSRGAHALLLPRVRSLRVSHPGVARADWWSC